MQTNFLPELLEKSPQFEQSQKIVRTCVHCGFCTATCPTYVLLGDELDSPRGRIYLMKRMFETGGEVPAEVVTHLDRCLSCLSCMTTCPSGVNYMHLIDHGREYIEKNYRRPLKDRLFRWLLAQTLPYPNRFRLAMIAGWLGRPLNFLFPPLMRPLLKLVPKSLPDPSPLDRPGVHPAVGSKKKRRVALLRGCAPSVLAPHITESAIRLLNRHGVDVVLPEKTGCCGALVHHLGRREEAIGQIKALIDALWNETDLEAVIVTASGCGTMIKDYGFILKEDKEYQEKAAAIARLTLDITEYMDTIGLRQPTRQTHQTVAYHSACSMQHGQQIREQPRSLLKKCGFRIKEIPEGHLCCGSAGSYNILQPELATRLRDRKAAHIEKLNPEIIATGNLGCMVQLSQKIDIPLVHTVELLDWSTGGPCPRGLAGES